MKKQTKKKTAQILQLAAKSVQSAAVLFFVIVAEQGKDDRKVRL